MVKVRMPRKACMCTDCCKRRSSVNGREKSRPEPGCYWDCFCWNCKHD